MKRKTSRKPTKSSAASYSLEITGAFRLGLPEQLHIMLEDLLHISAVGVENAALLSLDTTLLGRISEIAALRWTNISYHPEYKCLIVTLLRTKGNKSGRVQNLSVFPSLSDYASCTIFCLAAHAMCTNTAPTEDDEDGELPEGVGPHIFTEGRADKKLGAYLNSILKRFGEKFNLRLSSSLVHALGSLDYRPWRLDSGQHQHIL
jgi:hypothetical protein